VAVAGAGYFARFHLEAWQRLQAEGLVKLVAVAEPDASRRKAAMTEFGIPRGFAGAAQLLQATAPDILDIATPPATHLELVELAAPLGVACISQKPLAPTYEEAVRLVETAEQAGILLAVHENFRWMPWYLEMKRCLDGGLIGTPHTIAVRMRPGDGQGPDAYLSRQPYFQQMPRFLVHETVIHFIDTFRFLLGEVESVGALLTRRNPVIAGEDSGYVTLCLAGGTTAMIDANRLNDHPADNPRLTMGEHWLEGSHGVMRLDGFGHLHWKPHGGPEMQHPYAWRNVGFAGDCVYRQQKHLIEAFSGGVAPANTGREYLRNYAIEEAVYRAHEERRMVDV
jgi:predicted dehydrogenase